MSSLEPGAPIEPRNVRASRRQLFAATASSIAGFAAGCGLSAGRTEVVDTLDGRVLQWERDDLLVLVSGLAEGYRPGDQVQLKLILNNQTSRFGLYRLRTKLVGRAQQVVTEAPVASLQVKPLDAAELERTLELPANLDPGDYTLVIELPPWSLDGRAVGGGSLTAGLRVQR